MEISNNGTSCLVMDLGSYQKKSIVKFRASALITVMICVLSSMNNVTTPECLLESVMILHLLILIMKLNLSEFQNTRLFTCITCHVSMDKMLNSLMTFLV